MVIRSDPLSASWRGCERPVSLNELPRRDPCRRRVGLSRIPPITQLDRIHKGALRERKPGRNPCGSSFRGSARPPTPPALWRRPRAHRALHDEAVGHAIAKRSWPLTAYLIAIWSPWVLGAWDLFGIVALVLPVAFSVMNCSASHFRRTSARRVGRRLTRLWNRPPHDVPGQLMRQHTLVERSGTSWTPPSRASHVLPNRDFWEAASGESRTKYLISLVGVQGFEPWTR